MEKLIPIKSIDIWVAVPAVFQCAFWATVGTVTLLTYRHARKTVLQPLRTEVFKLQLEVMTEVFEIFTSQYRSINEYFGHRETFRINSKLYFNSYATIALGADPSSLQQPNTPADGTIIFKVDDIVHVHDPYTVPDGSVELPADPQWVDYKYAGVVLSEASVAAHAEIETFLKNPLLPSRCAKLLEELRSTSSQKLGRIADIFNEYREEMVTHYPDLEALTRATDVWLYQKWNQRESELQPVVDQLISYIRHFFAADEFDRSSAVKRDSIID